MTVAQVLDANEAIDVMADVLNPPPPPPKPGGG